MTTSTPPVSPSHAHKSKKSSHKSSEKKASANEMEVDMMAMNSDRRILRYSGFEGESRLARPLLLDDSGLIPREQVDTTLLTLKKSSSTGSSGSVEQVSLEGNTDRLDLFANSIRDTGSLPFKYAVALVPSDASEPIRVWDAEVLASERRVKRLKAVEESDAARLGSGSVESAATAAIDYKTAQNLLGEAFGTRKRKQAIISVEKNKVRPDSLGASATEFINQVLKEESSAAAASASSNEDVMASSLLPPYDKETLQVSEIYNIKSLIPMECYKALPVEAFAKITVKSSKDEIDEIQARFGMKDFWLNRILSAPRDDAGHTLRLLLFGHFLTSFRELKEAALNGPDGSVVALQSRLLECPEPVAIDLLNRFADRIVPSLSSSNSNQSSNSTNFLDKAKHKLPNALRDKAILYTLVVLLHLDGFRVNATSVAEVFAITPTKLVTFFRALGCTIDRPGRGEESNVNINNRLVPVKYARLTAPLTFPPPPKRQSKK